MNRLGWISTLVGLVFGLLLWTAPPVWAAAVCNPNIRATTPTGDFTLNDSNGTATHLKTGLIWMRCALGQSWNSTLKTCTGNPTVDTWGAALRAARGYSFAGHSDWRLPNAKELATIVEERCYGPSLNETVFPGVSSYGYWSSSTYAGFPGYAWVVDFDGGYADAYGKSSDGHARLVRGGQWFGDYVGGGGGQTYLLTVTIAGTGTGTVTSSPAGIACGDTCQADFPDGATVTLTGTAEAPTPSTPGSFLAGWTGCQNPLGLCRVEIDQVTPVTATFTRITMGGFGDVPVGYWADDAIYALRDAGITTGCGGGNYCPSNAVTRAQMAVFLERGVHGAGYVPPAAVGIFADVLPGYWAAAWIEALYADGVTGGCAASPLRYCPEDAVTRAQMAVFLLRAKHGQTYAPPAATGTVFGDVPQAYWAAAWIEQLAREGITAGCGGNNYCPDSPVARDQMAVFLGRTFLGMP